MDRRAAPDIELAYFGLTPETVGQGAGRWLMARAIELAFAHRPRRFWVHTCSLDHPGALNFYRRAGFQLREETRHQDFGPKLTAQVWELQL